METKIQSNVDERTKSGRQIMTKDCAVPRGRVQGKDFFSSNHRHRHHNHHDRRHHHHHQGPGDSLLSPTPRGLLQRLAIRKPSILRYILITLQSFWNRLTWKQKLLFCSLGNRNTYILQEQFVYLCFYRYIMIISTRNTDAEIFASWVNELLDCSSSDDQCIAGCWQ